MEKNPKRQRDPLEENNTTANELEVVLKRRRLAAGGVENHNPEQQAPRSPAPSRRPESEVKPDTPAIASVRLRVQQLTQRRDAALVQRCMSDPGTESPSSTLLQDVCHIGEGEFSSRLERFKPTTPESSPAPTPGTPSTRQLSSFVHNMQQQLNATMTPSTKEASRIRQAREDELKSLNVQPLIENMWLKRSFSDPSLTEDDSSLDLKEADCRLNFSSVTETMEDSFSGTSTFTTEHQPPATEHQPPATEHQPPATEHQPPATEHQPPATEHQPPATEHQPPATEHQPPATEHHLPESVEGPDEGMSTSTLIDKMFEGVLQAADREEDEAREDDSRVSEGREDEAREDDSRVSEGREDEAREDDSRVSEGREDEAREDDSRVSEGRENEAREDDSRVSEGWEDDSRVSEGRENEAREDDSRVSEGREDEAREDDSRVSEGRADADMETETELKLKSQNSNLGRDEGVHEKESENWNEKEEGEGEEHVVCNEEDFLSLPPSCVLSPLSKSVEAVVTPMRLVPTVPPLMVPCDPAEEVATPLAPPMYSIDAYRSQRKNPPPSCQSLTPGVQKPAEKSRITPAVNTKETIKALSDEVSKLQTVIHQTLQALSCCSDEEHGKGSLQEAEAEKLLLVSSEKHAALLAEISRLREGGAARQPDPERLQPCRGTVSINNIQLPLKVEFVCSAPTARPTHYFFILIRYGECNIVATPLATAADAENGDAISFPTSITLQDIRSNFEIDVEVYSLCNSAANSSSANVQQHRSSTRSKATPRKLLSGIKKSNLSSTSGALSLDPQRSSNFSLVGSHRISLSSLGQSEFLLDKMKFEGKIRRLLGDEFQEKVPFLSPLEGHIYLRLHSESHSDVQHQGFLTMFEDVSGFGAWQRLFFKLEGVILYYWNHPNEMGSKPAEGSISLCSFGSVRPVERDSCARPHTFELVNSGTLQQEHSSTLTKSWLSADTREERADWMKKLNQVLLDFQTWSRQAVGGESDHANTSSITATSRESIL